MSFTQATVRFLAVLLLWAGSAARAGATEVSGHVTVTAANGVVRSSHDASVVFWLTPLTAQPTLLRNEQAGSAHPRLVQRNKVFDPHVLVVQTGSVVDFPNRDPFFHNVFSLFNGKRFDLGLYEAGATRGVRFDRAGICYIFCNIHPQMSAVVVVVDSPYFGISDAHGQVTAPHVPSGRYQLGFWEEHCTSKALIELSRQVTVSDNPASLGTIQLQESDEPVAAHLNKYGKPYDPEVFAGPLYAQP
jgi:plastocyanin